MIDLLEERFELKLSIANGRLGIFSFITVAFPAVHFRIILKWQLLGRVGFPLFMSLQLIISFSCFLFLLLYGFESESKRNYFMFRNVGNFKIPIERMAQFL